MNRAMAACCVLFAAIGLAAIAVGAASGSLAGPLLFGLLFVAVGGLFGWVARWPVYARAPLPEEQLQRLGRPALATVLEVGDGQAGPGEPAAHRRVILEVTPVNEGAFRASARIAPSRPAPRVGDRVRVRFDPNHRRRLIVTG